MTAGDLIQSFSKIKESHNILLVTHDRPDGDALSSVCALTELFEILGKAYSAFCLDAPTWQYNFLPHLEKIKHEKNKLNFSDYDLIITIDCGSLKRTNLIEEISHKTPEQFIIEFDHHPKMDSYSDIEIRQPEASSTAEIIYQFLKINEVKLNKNLASCLLTGILTDTENFLFPSTSDKTIKIAAEMLTYGPSFTKIIQSAYRNKSLTAIRLWGQAMNNLKINRLYNIAYSVLTQADILTSQANEEELEGISNFLGNIEGVNGSLLLREEKDSRIKGSLRTTKNNINLSYLAQILGGGGHAKASGFTIDGHIETTGEGWKII